MMINSIREFMTIGSGQMSALLWIPMYFAPVVWTTTTPDAFEVFWQNLQGQMILFLLICQIPVGISGKMAYVDIAWPGGLVLLSVVGFTYVQFCSLITLIALTIQQFSNTGTVRRLWPEGYSCVFLSFSTV